MLSRTLFTVFAAGFVQDPRPRTSAKNPVHIEQKKSPSPVANFGPLGGVGVCGLGQV